MSDASVPLEPPVPPRRRTNFRTVALVFLVLLALGFSLAIVVYKKYVAYEPSVSKHVPAGADFVVRFDLTHVMLYEPFRRAVFPLVERGAPPAKPRKDRLAEQGLVIGADVRELLVAIGPAATDWVIGVGGRLPKSGAAKAIAVVLREEGRSVEERGDGYTLPPSTLCFTQASDGTLLFASNETRLAAAIAGGAAPPELNMGAGGLVYQPPGIIPGLRNVRAHWRAGSVVAVDARLELDLAGPPATALVEALLRGISGVDPLLDGPVRTVQVSSEGNVTSLHLQFPREAVERLVALSVDRFPF